MIDLSSNKFEVTITDIGRNGEGIGRIQVEDSGQAQADDNAGLTLAVFVNGTFPGDTALIRITDKKKNYAFGELIKIIKPSPHRTKPECMYAAKCGGCALHGFDYHVQCEYKTETVRNALTRIGGINGLQKIKMFEQNPPFHYRNKAVFHAEQAESRVRLGFYAAQSNKIVEINDCKVIHPVNFEILKRVQKYIDEHEITAYDRSTHTGLLRHIMTRVAFQTGEFMVCLVLNGNEPESIGQLAESLAEIKGMTGLHISVNKSRSAEIMGNTVKTVWGEEFITDRLLEFNFQISPLSFYQINSVMTETLYRQALELADLNGTETVIDAFCGIGTISLFFAKYAKKVIGVEINSTACADAINNAQLNEVDNVEFIEGMAEDIIVSLQEDGVKCDTLVIDPPRKGCDGKLIQAILGLHPKKIIYISCDSATMARDIKLLSADYSLKDIRAVDMFPWSVHTECVGLLELL